MSGNTENYHLGIASAILKRLGACRSIWDFVSPWRRLCLFFRISLLMLLLLPPSFPHHPSPPPPFCLFSPLSRPSLSEPTDFMTDCNPPEPCPVSSLPLYFSYAPLSLPFPSNPSWRNITEVKVSEAQFVLTPFLSLFSEYSIFHHVCRINPGCMTANDSTTWMRRAKAGRLESSQPKGSGAPFLDI